MIPVEIPVILVEMASYPGHPCYPLVRRDNKNIDVFWWIPVFPPVIPVILPASGNAGNAGISFFFGKKWSPSGDLGVFLEKKRVIPLKSLCSRLKSRVSLPIKL